MVADLSITRQLTRGATMVLLIIFAFLGCYQNLQENFWALCLWVKLKSLTEQFTRGLFQAWSLKLMLLFMWHSFSSSIQAA